MAKDKAAVSLAKKRWANTSEQERAANARRLNKARLDAIPAERRSEIAKNAAEARWAKKKDPKKKGPTG